MAWITKDSAGAAVGRRAEPYLTEQMRDRLTREILPRYEVKQGALLPALHMVQHEYSWIPPQALEEIAAFFGLKPADVLDTASFYEEYWLRPRGKHLVAVCRSIACEFCGHREVTEACKAALGIDVGETTPDGQFTLIEIECLGSCGTAPAMLVDETLHENVTPQSVAGRVRPAETAGGHAHGQAGAGAAGTAPAPRPPGSRR
ncbi:MAG TPA: NADH-quinone oxidoreductase subunit NuoE [Phycisphaerales bacterium]|nr:NADH-quinone oxidoreductase subunit NuoE [Phycisphaerales bacterium]